MRNGLRISTFPYFVGGIALKGMFVDEVGTAFGERGIVKLLAVTIDVESLAFLVISQDTP